MEKAFPDLQAEAREQMAMTHYLSQIDNAQLAFSVKQQKPSNLDAAVTATLEMESYLPQKGSGMVLGVAGTKLVNETDQAPVAAAATVQDSTAGMMRELLDRMTKLEIELKEVKDPKNKQRPVMPRQTQRGHIICWRCSRPGHIARDCYTNLYQGNELPRKK